MNWPGGQLSAPETLLDGKGRRIFWAWVTDPRSPTTQHSTGSGVQSLPRVLALVERGKLHLKLLARVRAALRRVTDYAEPALQSVKIGELEINHRARRFGAAWNKSPASRC